MTRFEESDDSAVKALERDEREVDAALERSEALRQAILLKAFTGRLVPPRPHRRSCLRPPRPPPG